MFRLTMHPASEGDCLVLAWGDEASPRHAVIDLGRQRDFRRLRPWLTKAANIDLFAISHIDADHIAGAMPMTKDATPPFAPADVWFNGHRHLASARKRVDKVDILSVSQGDKLERIITGFAWPWNAAFCGGAALAGGPPVALTGGLRLTLLSPADADLAKLEPDWTKWLASNRLRHADSDAEEGQVAAYETLGLMDVEALARQPFVEDAEPPNGSSIAFLAEFGGRRALLGADAHPSRIVQSLAALGHGPGNRLELSLFKLCHHGSKGNTSAELLSMVDCTRFAISTDGSRHGHPDAEAIARILVNDPARPKVLYFNTRQKFATRWQDPALQQRWSYTCVFPELPATEGLTIDI